MQFCSRDSIKYYEDEKISIKCFQRNQLPMKISRAIIVSIVATYVIVRVYHHLMLRKYFVLYNFRVGNTCIIEVKFLICLRVSKKSTLITGSSNVAINLR